LKILEIRVNQISHSINNTRNYIKTLSRQEKQENRKNQCKENPKANQKQ